MRAFVILVILTACSLAVACGVPGGRQRQRDWEEVRRRGAIAVVRAEFIFERAPFASCHASTIAESGGGLVAAWFGGSREGSPDVRIWVSRFAGGRWSEVMPVADGRQEDGTVHPVWNPVLFQPKSGPLLLFYKVGPSPAEWWGMLKESDDGGVTWSQPTSLPAGFLGPSKNKPVQLADGSLLCPSSTEHDGWRVQIERTNDLGRTWERLSGPVDAGRFEAIQPTLLLYTDGKAQLLCRSRSGAVVESWSGDGGLSWGELSATALPNPNSGLDAVVLKDGRALLVYNESAEKRTPLNVAVSRDGRKWEPAAELEAEPGEYSYPSVIQTSDGLIHVTYTWNRTRIKHVVLDPARLAPGSSPS